MHACTHTHILINNHALSASSIYYDPYHPPCSIYMLDSLFVQLLSKFSLVYFLVWNPPLHTPYISLPNHCLLFATDAYTVTTCFAVIPRLCCPFLSLSQLYLELHLLPYSTHITCSYKLLCVNSSTAVVNGMHAQAVSVRVRDHVSIKRCRYCHWICCLRSHHLCSPLRSVSF